MYMFLAGDSDVNYQTKLVTSAFLTRIRVIINPAHLFRLPRPFDIPYTFPHVTRGPVSRRNPTPIFVLL
jgi:hypothetical protein